MLPSEWAERFRILPAKINAEPGPFRHARTPYLAGIEDAVADPTIQELVVMKAPQVGFSEMFRNILGYWIDQDPGPCLIVLPTEEAARAMVQERILPLLHDTPTLRKYLPSSTRDVKLDVISLTSMPIYMAWAGSPNSLASRPCRYVILDEVDKYPPFSGRETDPLSLARKRTNTFGHRRKIIMGSTPTTRDGLIYKAWQACGEVRHFHVPCPQCGHVQRPIFTQVKYPSRDNVEKKKHADAILQGHLAYYQCERCEAKIIERDKPRMLTKGQWIGDGNRSATVGFHIPALISPWVSYSETASMFVKAQGDAAAIMDFRNGIQGEPSEDQIANVKPSAIRDKIPMAAPVGILPDWTIYLVATADTQKDHFVWTVRAWGKGFRSQGIAFGLARTFDELTAATLGTCYTLPSKGEFPPQVLYIDSGGGKSLTGEDSRTEEVYAYAQRMGEIVRPTKGSSRPMALPISLTRGGKAANTVLRMVDVGWFKNRLSNFINDIDQSKWLPPGNADDSYIAQMASEHKVMVRDKGVARFVWRPVVDGSPNHFWDCEVLQCAAVEELGLGRLVDEVAATQGAQPMQAREQQPRDEPQREARGGSSWATAHKSKRW